MTVEHRAMASTEYQNGNVNASNSTQRDDREPNSNYKMLSYGKLIFIYITSMSFILSMPLYWKVDNLLARNAISKQMLTCTENYINGTNIRGDSPQKCVHVVMDNIFSGDDLDQLVSIAKKGLHYSNKSSGRTIFNFQTGMAENENGLVNVTKLPEAKGLFTSADYEITRKIIEKLRATVANEYELPIGRLHQSQPSYFSRLTPGPLTTGAERFWLSQLDKHPHFPKSLYTAILQLGTHGKEFEGGRLIFVKNKTLKNVSLYQIIEAKKGRVALFKTNPGNAYYTTRVISGEQYTFFQSFMCNNATTFAHVK